MAGVLLRWPELQTVAITAGTEEEVTIRQDAGEVTVVNNSGGELYMAVESGEASATGAAYTIADGGSLVLDDLYVRVTQTFYFDTAQSGSIVIATRIRA